jgi:divalent metal cation (Fe/Co/Zn/Cd) transporter
MTETTKLNSTEEKYYNLAYWLGIFTIVYNLVEGILATVLGYEDETLALFGFGLDSFIEMISGLGIVHMITRIRHSPESPRSNFEKTALKITGYSFYTLVVGLTISSIYNIIQQHAPETTFWGVVISLISIVVMIFLYFGKMKAGKMLNSSAIIADAHCTRVCIYMSCTLLAASVIYELTGFIYADSIGTLGLAWFSYSEGKECFEKAAGHDHCHH